MPLFSRRPTTRELRRREREAGYAERQTLDGAGQIVWHYYLNLYRHDFANDIDQPVQEYCGKATCRNPAPRVNWLGFVVARGTPEFHYPALTPTNQTANVGGKKAREVAQDYIPATTFSEVP